MKSDTQLSENSQAIFAGFNLLVHSILQINLRANVRSHVIREL